MRWTNINREASRSALGGKRGGTAESGRAHEVLWRRGRPPRRPLRAGSRHGPCAVRRQRRPASRLSSILMGIYRRDAGKIWRNGREVEFGSPAEALASGIAIIEQELTPIPQMTVAENIFLGREPPGRFGGVDFRNMYNMYNKKSSENILFIASDELDDLFEMLISHSINYSPECLIVLDSNLKNDINYQKLITILLSNENQNLFFVEKEEPNLSQHLYRLSGLFYNKSATNLQILKEIVDEINSGLIHLDVDFNDAQYLKLEKAFKITE